LRLPFKLLGSDDECELGKSLLKLIFGGVSDILFVFVVRIFVDLRDESEEVGMLQIEKHLKRPLSSSHRNRLTPNNGGQRRKALLTVQQQLCGVVRVNGLTNGETASWNWLVCLPEENRSGRIPTIERVQQVPNPWSTPDVATLHLRQAEFSSFDRLDEFLDARFSFTHFVVSLSSKSIWD
jgi:hypothetical protein